MESKRNRDIIVTDVPDPALLQDLANEYYEKKFSGKYLEESAKNTIINILTNAFGHFHIEFDLANEDEDNFRAMLGNEEKKELLFQLVTLSLQRNDKQNTVTFNENTADEQWKTHSAKILDQSSEKIVIQLNPDEHGLADSRPVKNKNENPFHNRINQLYQRHIRKNAKDVYKKYFKKEERSLLSDTEIKAKILVKSLLENFRLFYKSYQDTILKLNSEVLQGIADHGSSQLKNDVRDIYSKHLKEYKKDSDYVVNMYRIKNIDILDIKSLISTTLLDHPDSNQWEDLYLFAEEQIEEYQSPWLYKSEDRKASLLTLREQLKEIDNDINLNHEDKITRLIKLMQKTSMDAAETDFEKDREIGNWSLFSYRNVWGSRYQDMLTSILNKARLFYISQNNSEIRTEKLDEADELERLYQWLNMLIQRANFEKVRNDEAIHAIHSDAFLSKPRPESISDKKHDLALILDRLKTHQARVNDSSIRNYSKDAFAVSLDNLIQKIGQYIKTQRTDEVSKPINNDIVYSSIFSLLRSKLQSGIHKLADTHENYLETISRDDGLLMEYANEADHSVIVGSIDTPLEKNILFEIMRNIKNCYRGAEDIVVTRAEIAEGEIAEDKKFITEFQFTNSRNESIRLKFTIESFSREKIKNNFHQVTWPQDMDPVEEEQIEPAEDHATPENLYSLNYHDYLKHIAKKITPAVVNALKSDNSPWLAEFRSLFLTTRRREKPFNRFHYNIVYGKFLEKLRTPIKMISATQEGRIKDLKKLLDAEVQDKKNDNQPFTFNENLAKTPQQLQLEIEQIDDFIMSIYLNESKILGRSGQFAIKMMAGKNPLSKDKKKIYNTLTGNEKGSFFKKVSHQVDAITADNPLPDQQETPYLRFMNVVGKTYSPQTGGNMPSIQQGKNTRWTKIRMGTQAEFIDGNPSILPFFEAFLKAQARCNPDQKITHLYFNYLPLDEDKSDGLLSKMQRDRERKLSAKLHEFAKTKTQTNLAVITLPANKGLMSRKMLEDPHGNSQPVQDILDKIARIATKGSPDPNKPADEESILDKIARIAKESLDPDKPADEVRDFYISKDIKDMLYENIDEEVKIRDLLNESIKALGFSEKLLLNNAEIQALFIDFINLRLSDFIIDKLKPLTVQFSCREGIDRGAKASLYFDLVKSIELKNPMTKDEFITGLHGASIMAKGRAMNHHQDRFWNAVSMYMDAQVNNPGIHIPEWLIRMKKDFIIGPVIDSLDQSKRAGLAEEEKNNCIAALNELNEKYYLPEEPSNSEHDDETSCCCFGNMFGIFAKSAEKKSAVSEIPSNKNNTI